MEETISRMAGSQHGIRQSAQDLAAAATAIGRPAAQRTTLYEHVDREVVGVGGTPTTPTVPTTAPAGPQEVVP